MIPENMRTCDFQENDHVNERDRTEVGRAESAERGGY
jgi:hypothetical protein